MVVGHIIIYYIITLHYIKDQTIYQSGHISRALVSRGFVFVVSRMTIHFSLQTNEHIIYNNITSLFWEFKRGGICDNNTIVSCKSTYRQR